MSPAKVISQNIIFYVVEGEEIHNLEPYDRLPLEDRRQLTGERIIGTQDGYTFKTNDCSVEIKKDCDSRPAIPGCGGKWDVKDCTPSLVLPMGTRIEPVTNQDVEGELAARNKPTRKER